MLTLASTNLAHAELSILFCGKELDPSAVTWQTVHFDDSNESTHLIHETDSPEHYAGWVLRAQTQNQVGLAGIIVGQNRDAFEVLDRDGRYRQIKFSELNLSTVKVSKVSDAALGFNSPDELLKLARTVDLSRYAVILKYDYEKKTAFSQGFLASELRLQVDENLEPVFNFFTVPSSSSQSIPYQDAKHVEPIYRMSGFLIPKIEAENSPFFKIMLDRSAEINLAQTLLDDTEIPFFHWVIQLLKSFNHSRMAKLFLMEDRSTLYRISGAYSPTKYLMLLLSKIDKKFDDLVVTGFAAYQSRESFEYAETQDPIHQIDYAMRVLHSLQRRALQNQPESLSALVKIEKTFLEGLLKLYDQDTGLQNAFRIQKGNYFFLTSHRSVSGKSELSTLNRTFSIESQTLSLHELDFDDEGYAYVLNKATGSFVGFRLDGFSCHSYICLWQIEYLGPEDL